VIERRRGRRCRVAGEPASERIWAWLTPSERLALQAFADESGERIGEIVREAVNVYVAEASERKIFSVTHNSRPSLS
jgi:hypothetical protein